MSLIRLRFIYVNSYLLFRHFEICSYKVYWEQDKYGLIVL